MMDEIRLIDIKKQFLYDNKNLADEIREELKRENVFMLNLMASPGAGKQASLLKLYGEWKKIFKSE